jgi:formate hydrogenlyase subunit 6/NADH:ubiquinone oxidoreductase subunit I
MKLEHLKIIRVVLSILFFTATAFVFLDISGLLPYLANDIILYLQFVPSLIKFIYIPAIAGAGFIFILLLTFLFGRVYCSTVCPIGTLQDAFSFITKKIRKKKQYDYKKPQNILRYSILGITAIVMIGGSLTFVNLLDPYSNFGRVISDMLRPVYIFLNNAIVEVWEDNPLFSYYDFDFETVKISILSISFLYLLTIIILSILRGRLFCNTICPVGTLLSLVSRYSIFKIAFDKNSCTGCGLCENVCKAECINSPEMKIDFDRCVACYNCLRVCPESGFKYKMSLSNLSGSNQKWMLKQVQHDNGKSKWMLKQVQHDNGKSRWMLKQVQHDNKEEITSKRNFIISTGAVLLSLFGIIKAQAPKPKKETKIPEKRKYPVIPPGANSIRDYKAKCTGCHLCVSACPSQVIQPSLFAFGLSGIQQPVMDYWTSFCNFECIICTKICPTGALLPVSKEKKKTLQLGKTTFIKDNCIVETEKTECGACSEHCPTKAVQMVPYGNLSIPEVNNEICVGCGACEWACPTKPFKAIYVQGNPVHLKAKKPKSEKLKEKVQEDFPF